MKLHTLLLPTGEFVIVGSDVDPTNMPPSELMSSFADGTGAAGVLFTQQSVVIEDALFDENARRRPDKVEEPAAELEDTDETTEIHQHFSTYLPNVEFPSFSVDSAGTATLTGRAVTSDWVDIGQMSKDSLETFFGVRFDREYGPAGQVKGQPGDPDFLASEAFQQGTEPRVDVELPSNEVLVSTIEEFGKEVVEPTPQVGDTVRIVGWSSWRQENAPIKDTIGKIKTSQYPDFGHLVEFDHPVTNVLSRWFYPTESLEVLRG